MTRYQGCQRQFSWIMKGIFAARATRTPTALAVEQVERDIEVVSDVLRYELRMSMESVPLTRHLVGELRRTEEP